MSKIRLNIWSTYHYAPLDDGDGGDDGNGADDDDNDDDDDDDDQSPRVDPYLFLAPKWLQRHSRSSMPF